MNGTLLLNVVGMVLIKRMWLHVVEVRGKHTKDLLLNINS